ncbi:unnamed protein product [Cylicocyclus nassatus]|uniref:SXP/RAL-2 family protein Ani s 5-like cation-binding domain-containing protein n=1 Tax=Cylicocyclus nassatus TaxID=53992 RepID=A0AA36GZI8_CYLNA|nr:unnamed protein product [Cylicocyclus nassatus]
MILVILVSLTCCTTASKPGFNVPAETERIKQQEQESIERFSVLPTFPFDDIDYPATREFLRIFGDNTLTGHEWNSRLLNWAKKNGVYMPFLHFKREMERRRQANEENCLRSTHALHQFFRKYYHVGNNYAYTWEQVNDVREDLIKGLTAKQLRIATLIAESYTPRDVQQLTSHRNLFLQDEIPDCDPQRDC